MDSKKKTTILFLGSLLVAVMFLTGAAGLGSGNSAPSSNNAPSAAHTLHITNTFFASGIANATVYGYGSSIKLILYNKSYANKTTSLLASLENNGSISTYTQVSGAFDIYAGKYNAYQIHDVLLKGLGNRTFSFSVPEYVRLPVYTALGVGNETVTANTSLAHDYQVYYTNLTGLNSTIEVKVSALVGILNNTYILVPNNVTVTPV